MFSFRVFGSGFLSHQDAISDMQVVEQVDPIDMMEQVTRGSDNRVEFYQQNIVTMDMKVTVEIDNFEIDWSVFRQMYQNLSRQRKMQKTS